MAAALQQGDIFASRYRIVRELAAGGMGAVYEVVHTVTERRCALKVMLAHTVEREILRKRFMQESRLAAQIGSEYIVDVLDAGVDEDTKAPYLVMELLDGEDLGQRLQRLGPLSREEAVLYLSHVALALDRTHQAGIVHRDLKASNLFLTHREDGSPLVKVLDFGVAKVLTLERSGEQRTQTVGTPIYMAPEQFRADGRISAATDIYALGMLSYTLLVGMHYWRAEHESCDNPFAFASIAVNGPKDPPSTRAVHEGVPLSDAYDAWFAKATGRWPQDRFPTAGAAIQELAVALGVDSPQAAAPGSTTGPLPKPSSLNRPPTPSVPVAYEPGSGRVKTGSTGSGRRTGPREPTGGSDALHGEHHTEVSLSVTSGSTPLPIPEKPAPRKGAGVYVALAVLAIVVVGIGVARSFRPGPTAHELGAKMPAATVQATAVAKTPEPSSVPPVETAAPVEAASAAPDNDKASAMRIEDLPMAAPQAPAARAKKPTSRMRTAPPAPAPVAPAAPKQVDRDSLYGRD